MQRDFHKIGVIGAGVMGAQLAAIFAGAGAQVELLDIVPPDVPPDADVRLRSRVAAGALSRLPLFKPPALYSRADLSRIRPGNLEDHLRRLSACDWVVEAVVERLDVKRFLFARLAGVLGKETVLSSNTSGILRRSLAEGMEPDLARRFLVTHFFNPPRHMKLLEIVGEGADPAAVEGIVRFAEGRLGKGVVRTKDTPLFIANRIGVFYVLDTIHRVVNQGWPLEAVDAVLGRPAARPASGVFRTLDMAGIDTLSFVAAELVKGCPADEGIGRCRIPQFVQQMVVKGFVGDKSGKGFYWKDRATGQIQTFDPHTLDYRPRVSFSTPSIAEASKIADPAERIRRIAFADDQAGEIAWPAISRMILYAARRIPEISDDPAAVDAAMRWGYRWELGPFETWDALGVREVAARLEKEGEGVPPLVRALLDSGHERFYEWRGRQRRVFDGARRGFRAVAGSEERAAVGRIKATGGLVEENAGASLVDAGDGVFLCEFHTKMNAIDADIVRMLHAGVERAEREGAGLLVANDAEQFSVGANLLLILMAAQQKRWGEIEGMVRGFQELTERLRFAKRPVMAAPAGMTLGGGCEICLACPGRTAAMESYVGLVEAGAGLIPAGGGCKNLLLAMESKRGMAGGPQPKVSAAFELIATAKVAGSAREAMELGLFSHVDAIVMDRELLLHEAKGRLLEWSKEYRPPAARTDILLPGRGGEMALVGAVRGFVAQGKASGHDALVAGKLARVLAGGDRPTIHETSEEHLLELEREAFLSLVAEPKSQERMANLLKTGKPLRN